MTGAEQLATAYVPAAHVKLTVGFVLFHPLELGEGETAATIEGAAGATV